MFFEGREGDVIERFIFYEKKVFLDVDKEVNLKIFFCFFFWDCLFISLFFFVFLYIGLKDDFDFCMILFDKEFYYGFVGVFKCLCDNYGDVGFFYSYDVMKNF